MIFDETPTSTTENTVTLPLQDKAEQEQSSYASGLDGKNAFEKELKAVGLSSDSSTSQDRNETVVKNSLVNLLHLT